LERIHRCRTLVHLNGLAFLHAEGGAVHALSVDRDVTVDKELTSLRHGAGEAGTQHEGVEERFEELEHDLTSQTGKTSGFLVELEHLGLTDAVLRAQRLLLLEAERVVAVVATAGASVLAWRVRATLEVLLGLGCQSNAEGARDARHPAITCWCWHC